MLATLAVMLLAACGSRGAPKVSPPSRAARQGRLVGPAVPLTLTLKTDASMVGTPPVHVTPTRLAMATRSIGWAAGKGLGNQAQPYLALATSDGGATFRQLFTAPAPIVGVAAPDARHGIRLPKGWQLWALGYWRPADGWVVAMQGNQFRLFRCDQRSCTRVPAPFQPLWAQMTGPSSGFAAGQDVSGRWAVFMTRDEGRLWTERILPGYFNMGGTGAKGNLAWLYQVDDYPAAPDPPHPLYGGTIALISPDRGHTWREIALPAGLQAVVSLSFANASDGLLITSSPVTGTSCWSTSDGGHTFRLLP